VEALLYQLYDWQRSALQPWRLLAQAANELYAHPDSPLSYLPGSRNVAAAFDLMARLTQRYERPEFGITSVTVGEREFAVDETCDVEKPFCRLLHFAKPGAPAQPKVLVFAPLSGHFATLLRDTVRTLLPDHDVYITDWIDAKEVPLGVGPFHFDDYVAYVREFIAHLDGKATLPAALAAAQRETRRYAKRQMTWMRGQMGSWPRVPAENPDDQWGQFLALNPGLTP